MIPARLRDKAAKVEWRLSVPVFRFTRPSHLDEVQAVAEVGVVGKASEHLEEAVRHRASLLQTPGRTVSQRQQHPCFIIEV